jgi:hypothetical protein
MSLHILRKLGVNRQAERVRALTQAVAVLPEPLDREAGRAPTPRPARTRPH